MGTRRIELSDLGIRYLERALGQRSKYHEAMTYLNLLYRQKSYAYFDDPDQWQKCVDKAVEWRDQTLLASGKAAASPAPADAITEDDPSSDSKADEETTHAARKRKK
jgi:hypothetical protein